MEHQKPYRLRLLRTSVPACKSAHAGSIPASASTFESPVDQGLRGFFVPAKMGGCVPHFFEVFRM